MPLLSAESISVRFGGITALNRADVTAETGQITGLIGPNGAGKTTLFNVISGLQPPTSGRVVLDGRDITDLNPHQRARAGVSRTFQKLEAFSSLSARENVQVAIEQRPRDTHRGVRPEAEAEELLDQVGIAEVARFTVGTLPTGTARRVELARALATRPRVLLLDEPSSGLDEDETAAMARLLCQLAADGLAVLIVEHDMSLVMDNCNEIHVLDFGSVIASGPPSVIQADAAVRTAYLGAELDR
jgi:branched-chain amino acid transport system ATP-binding protein